MSRTLEFVLSSSSQATQDRANKILPLMLLLFVGSGCAALIYEIVWFQMLQLVIGSTGVSIGVLLGTFMGGMFLGSLFLPKYVAASKHPLKVYALLEAGIGVLGLLLLGLIPLVSGVYSSLVPPGLASILLRGAVCVLLLLPPTMLMGATLPAISRWVEATPRGVSWMGFFYAGNIAGAVLGAILAGFYLLRVFDLTIATLVAVGLNVAVSLLALVLARSASYEPNRSGGTQGEENKESPPAVGVRLIYVAIGLSGLTALGAQVVWTRLLSLLLGASTYTFSIILAVFLIGLGIGSTGGSYLARELKNPRQALGICQLFIVVGLAWTAYMLSSSLPYWPINPSITSDPWPLFQMDFFRTVWAIFPSTVLWGASFPLAVAAAASRGQDSGRLVGSVYAANTLGAILGAVGFGIILIPWLGTQMSQQVLMVGALISAGVLLLPVTTFSPGGRLRPGGAMVGLAIGAIVTVGLVATVSPIPPVLVAYGRYAPTYLPPNALYVGEGMNSSVAVTELENGVRNFHVSGKIEASTEPQDMRLQRMLGHISALAHDEPKTVLVVGFGAGVTAGSFLLHPSVERIVICEIEPLIPEVVSQYFGGVNYNVLDDPRVEVIYDDARHYILTSDEKFDVITSDPIHPWVKGAASLYTQEYFELAKAHLNPGGVMTQWVPLYESLEEVVKSEVGTFFNVFPEGTIWSNDISGQGYDVVLVGKEDGSPYDIDGLQQRLDQPAHFPVVQSLLEVGFNSGYDLLRTFAGWGPDLAPWLEDAQINRDRNLRLMYMAGLGMNRYEQGAIYSSILSYRRFPGELFTGSESTLEIFRTEFGR